MMRRLILSSVVILVAATSVQAQWLTYPDPRIPRFPDGKPNLSAPAPHTADGKPDLSGVWRLGIGWAYSLNVAADLQPSDIAPSADALYRQRMANLGVDDSSAVGCLPSGPRFILGSGAGPQLVKIEQKEHVILVLSELLRYRQIFMDGRTLPTDPSPSFMGYSVGHWEGETLVVESNGFNDRSWLDSGGHPHTEALRITERFTRTSMGRMELQVTLSDPDLYKKPLTIPVSVTLAPDTELLEFVCNEQENRRMAIGMTDAEKSIRVDPSVLRNFVGTYETDATNRPVRRYTVRMDQDWLVVDLDGRGSIPMVPLSQSSFSIRFIEMEFVRDTAGKVTHMRNMVNGNRWEKVE